MKLTTVARNIKNKILTTANEHFCVEPLCTKTRPRPFLWSYANNYHFIVTTSASVNSIVLCVGIKIYTKGKSL